LPPATPLTFIVNVSVVFVPPSKLPDEFDSFIQDGAPFARVAVQFSGEPPLLPSEISCVVVPVVTLAETDAGLTSREAGSVTVNVTLTACEVFARVDEPLLAASITVPV
jgi:hypothetical protein